MLLTLHSKNCSPFTALGSSCLVFADGQMQRFPAWAFMLAAVGTGVIGLIPYLALRQPNQAFTGTKSSWIKLLDSRATGIGLTISSVILLAYAAIAGDWSAFAAEFQSNKFVHGMSLAFCLFCLLFPYPTLADDDRARRGLPRTSLWSVLVWIPLFGALMYLCLRPPLPGAQLKLSDL
jgi:hypothetical protein